MPNRNENILARWQTTIETAVCTPLEFYELVANALLESEFPNLSFSGITRREGGWLSPRRIYLRIRFERLYFDVFAFVAGNSLVVGWWLHEDSPGLTDLLAEIPGLGLLLDNTSRAATYYRVDFIEYFQRAVHNSVLTVVDILRDENGFSPLPAEARVPVWEEIW